MTFKYDKATDSLVIVLRSSEIDDSEEIRPGVIADFDMDGSLVSIEILNASKKVEVLNQIEYSEPVQST